MAITQFGGWPFGVDLDYLLNEVKVHARLSSSGAFDHLGSTADYRNQFLADAINRALDEYRERLPSLNKTTTTQALTANTAKYDIPSDLHGTAIAEMYWSDSGSNSLRDLAPLRFVTNAEIQQLPASWKNGEVTQEYPEAWGYDPGNKAQYQLFPTPSSATPVLTILYRKEPGYMTGDMLTTLVHAFTNGTFAADSDWVKGTGWTISGGLARFAGTAAALLTQATAAAGFGQVWRMGFDVMFRSGDQTVTAILGDQVRSAVGHYEEDITIPFLYSALLSFTAAGSGPPSISIDNITIRQMLPGVMSRHQRLLALKIAADLIEPENYERRPVLELFYEKEMRQAQKTIRRNLATLQSGNTGQSRGNSHIATGKLFGRLDDSTTPRRRR